MFRITKLTDYGVVLLTNLAQCSDEAPRGARDLAEEVGLPLPTVSKILKALARGGLLESHRGTKGGYTLTRPPEEISVAEIIAALEGPIAITECVAAAPGTCDQEPLCSVRANWQMINRTVHGALDKITLSQMIRPAPDFERWLEMSARGGGAGGSKGVESEKTWARPPKTDGPLPVREGANRESTR
ncbi:MAG: SUF system Fe-S cluster assembly regulator [Candidatus Eisenbacteria bacterium]